MFYILIFIFCFIADKIQAKYTFPYYLLVVCIYIILCFGYMTGSDWRQYELMYLSDSYSYLFDDYEYGFVIFSKFLKKIISDFWVFNGLVKVCVLYIILHFFSIFTNYKYTVLALSFTFAQLTFFLIVDCPMRFMIGTGLILLSIKYFLEKKYIPFAILQLLSLTFHRSMIIFVVLTVSMILFANIFSKSSKVSLTIIFITLVLLTTTPYLYETVMSKVLTLNRLEYFADRYGDSYNVQRFDSLGIFKNIFLCLFVIYHKDDILKMKFGNILFYMSYLSFCIWTITSNFRIGFRIGIFNFFFTVVVIVNILSQIDYKTIIYKKYIKYSLWTLFTILFIRNIYSSYKFYPYSNSIPYILTHHLPYTYRDTHNVIEYKKTFGQRGDYGW